jgi:hypothetical protein
MRRFEIAFRVGHSRAPVSDPHLRRLAQTRISVRNRSGNSQTKANRSDQAPCSARPKIVN